MQILAFGHKSGVGKDTIANLIVKVLRTQMSYQDTIDIAGFADPLKAQCYQEFKSYGHLSPEQYEFNRDHRKTILPELNMTAVDLWVSVGNYYRTLDEDYWVKKLFDKYKTSSGVLLIKDLRYPNEAEAVKRHGGKIIKINNDRAAIYNSVADTAMDNYSGWDMIINNNTSISDLLTAAKTCIKTFING